jgi:hypothetical protein
MTLTAKTILRSIFMKTKNKLIITAMAIVLAFTFITCDNGDGKKPVVCTCPEGTTHEPNQKCCEGTDCNCQIAEPKNQSDNTTLTNLFGEGHSATIKGDFTDSEWGSGATGVAGRFKIALEAAYTGNIPPVQGQFLDVFRQSGVTIIVEKTTAYSNWKTIGDGKTLYIRFDKLNSIQSTLTVAVQSMARKESTNG